MSSTCLTLAISVLVVSVFMAQALPYPGKDKCRRLLPTPENCRWGEYSDYFCERRQCFQGPGDPCSTILQRCNDKLYCDPHELECKGCLTDETTGQMVCTKEIIIL